MAREVRGLPEGADIETSIDRLLNYVRAKGQVELYSAAQAMALPPAQVEKIAGMLEQSGLLEVRYRLTGILLVAKDHAQPEQKVALERKASVLKEQEQRLEREVKDSERLVEFVEEDLMKRLHSAENALTEIENTGEFTEEELRTLREEIDTLRVEVDAVRQRTKLLEHEEEEFLQRLTQFSHQLNMLKSREVMLTLQVRKGGRIHRFFKGIWSWFRGLFRRRKQKEAAEA